MTEADVLLKQNLVIEPDLQNFIDFTMESVAELGGNTFAASITLLELVKKLRSAGIGTGRPSTVRLLIHEKQIQAQWDDHEPYTIADLEDLSPPEKIERLRLHLQNSTIETDPNLLLQRNAQMERYFSEARTRAERKMQVLEQSLRMRQLELQETTNLAKTDPLTGLFNRRAFDERMKQSFLHTMRQRSSPLSLLLFDLDHFKDINDRFGHQVGDEHLKKMANTLRTIIREDVDLAFRFGGDEFAAVIYADYPLACEKAKQVLKAMENKVSIGIANINQDTQDDLTVEEFINRADNALYEAKNRGRGQIMSHYCMTHSSRECQSMQKEMSY